MNRRQFIPMLLGTAFIDVSKLNFSKSDVYLKKKEIFSSIDSKNFSDFLLISNNLTIFQFNNTLLSKINKDVLIYQKLLINRINNKNIFSNHNLENFINTYIFPPINSKDDLKHYYENIEILEQLNS